MKIFIKTFSIFYFSFLSYSQSDDNYKFYGELFEFSESINYNLEKDIFILLFFNLSKSNSKDL